MVKCRVCGKKIELKRIEDREVDNWQPQGMYDKKPMNSYGGKDPNAKMEKVKIYGCSDRHCISSEMTEKEYLEEKEKQERGY
jgi:hypothetical protein